MNRPSLVAAAVGLLVAVLPSAQAQEAARQGWWAATGTGIALPVAPIAPDVPADGLFIQGGATPESPQAFAALVVPAPAGDATRSLVLQATSSPGNLAGSVINACALPAVFEPAQGGPIADAPRYDCTSAVEAIAGADGVTFTFDARPFLIDGAIRVALIPGSATTRVALTRPGPDVLRSVASPPASTSDPAPVPPPENTATSSPVGELVPAPNVPTTTAGGGSPSTPSPGGAAVSVPLLPTIGTPATSAAAVAALLLGLTFAAVAWRRSGSAAVAAALAPSS